MLPVSRRASTNMPAPDRTIPASSIRLCTSTGRTPAHSIGAATADSTGMASENVSVRRSGIEDVAVEDARGRCHQGMGRPSEAPHVEVHVLVIGGPGAEIRHLRPRHDGREQREECDRSEAPRELSHASASFHVDANHLHQAQRVARSGDALAQSIVEPHLASRHRRFP